MVAASANKAPTSSSSVSSLNSTGNVTNPSNTPSANNNSIATSANTTVSLNPVTNNTNTNCIGPSYEGLNSLDDLGKAISSSSASSTTSTENQNNGTPSNSIDLSGLGEDPNGLNTPGNTFC